MAVPGVSTQANTCQYCVATENMSSNRTNKTSNSSVAKGRKRKSIPEEDEDDFYSDIDDEVRRKTIAS